MSKRMSDKIEVRENCVKMQRREGGKEIILSKPAFISLTVGGGLTFASVRTSRGATFSPSSHFFHPPFSPVSAPNAEWPITTPAYPPEPLATAASDPLLWLQLLCIHAACSALEEFLTRPWIRLVAPHSLFLFARLDTNGDIRWTLIRVTSLPGMVTELLPQAQSRAVRTTKSGFMSYFVCYLLVMIHKKKKTSAGIWKLAEKWASTLWPNWLEDIIRKNQKIVGGKEVGGIKMTKTTATKQQVQKHYRVAIVSLTQTKQTTWVLGETLTCACAPCLCGGWKANRMMPQNSSEALCFLLNYTFCHSFI